MFRHRLNGCACALAANLLVAQFLSSPACAEAAVTLEELSVTGLAGAPPPTSSSIVPSSPAAAALVRRLQLPQTSASVTTEQIDRTVNVIDTEDAVKYLPSLFVRKRNTGDTQPVLATRTWGSIPAPAPWSTPTTC